jgi:hypothetical protein
MPDNFSLYEFTKNLSLVGWVILIAVMIAAVYVIAKGTELLVTKKCPFCENRIPKRLNMCKFCKKAV